MKPKCFCCNSEIPILLESEKDGPPDCIKGAIFTNFGSYGNLFDPMDPCDPAYISIYICNDCLKKKAEEVSTYRQVRTTQTDCLGTLRDWLLGSL